VGKSWGLRCEEEKEHSRVESKKRERKWNLSSREVEGKPEVMKLGEEFQEGGRSQQFQENCGEVEKGWEDWV
jgi:hypothetical protein